jgi:PIN domain nuclease of toxin-antitoxin system
VSKRPGAEVEWVVDASAVLALVLGEPGGAWLESRIDRCGLSVVNLEEVLVRLTRGRGDLHAELNDVLRLGVTPLPFDVDDALGTAALWPNVVDRGLSLGDRACLWSARRRRVAAITADGAWTVRPDGSVPKRSKLVDTTVIQLRPRAAR